MTTEIVEQPEGGAAPAPEEAPPVEEVKTGEDGGTGTDSDDSMPELEDQDEAMQRMHSQVGHDGPFVIHIDMSL